MCGAMEPDDVGKPARNVTLNEIVMMALLLSKNHVSRKLKKEMNMQWIKLSDINWIGFTNLPLRHCRDGKANK